MTDLISKGFFIGLDALIFVSAYRGLYQINDTTKMFTDVISTENMNRGSIVYTNETPTERSDVVIGTQVLSEVWDYDGEKKIYINNIEITGKTQDIRFISGQISMTGHYIKVFENGGTSIRYKKI